MIPRNEVIQGGALEVLRTLPDSSVDCAVTSPPYFQVRSYQGGALEFGQEAHIDEWVEHLRTVAAEIARVLVPWGAFWLNVGDVYATRPSEGAPAKSLLLGPERLAQALLADGWLVRNRVSWTKPNPLPSSAADRLTQSWEFVYLLVRERHYFFDLDAIRAPLARSKVPRSKAPERRRSHGGRDHGHSGLTRLSREGLGGHPLGKNPGDAWRIAGARVRGHTASFPTELIRCPILATCPEKVCLVCGKPWQRARHPVRFADGKPRLRALLPCECEATTRPGLVLDPFMGSGTVALVAREHGRDWLGIELNPEYVQLTRERLERSA
ncbi:MAG TPA: site-specific DNA-methyltransferase [Solirubrobacteraceae bacterium]